MLIDFTKARKGTYQYGKKIGLCDKCGRKGQITFVPTPHKPPGFYTVTHTAKLVLGCMLMVRDHCEYRKQD